MAGKVRVAMLGCGGLARKRHAPNLVAMENAELVACCDRLIESAQTIAQEATGGTAAVYRDYIRMLDEAKPDAVYIVLPPFAHSDQVEQAARRGIHVFIEKPIALNMDLALRMVDAAERAGIITQVGFQFRFGAAVEWVYDSLQSGETGPLGLMLARYFCNSLHAPWWRHKDKSGGQLVEQVIHMIDLLRYFFGRPVYVTSRQANLFHRDLPDYTVEDVSGTLIGFENGGLGIIAATNGAIPGQWINQYHLVAHGLTVDFTDANHAIATHTAEDPPRTETIADERDPWQAVSADFIAAVQEHRPARVPIREGALTLELALAASHSAERGEQVLITPRVGE